MTETKKIKFNIPKNVLLCINSLKQKGFEAYIVGGCTRDLFMDKTPADWDITTNAIPEQIQAVFEELNIKTFYENSFGTVGIIFPKNEIIEITTYRSESTYSDSRHPDKVNWSKHIEEDLNRRDFTINAIAITPVSKNDYQIIDLFSGQKDLKNKIIKTVGSPEQRFSEDYLRMMRAIRFQTTLGNDWKIEKQTEKAIIKYSYLLEKSAKERIRDELIKIINSNNAGFGIEALRKTKLLQYILPELELGINVKQNKHHIYDCYKHNLECLNYATKKDFNFHIKMAALLHDIGKPATKKGFGENATFYNHEIVGAKMAEKALNRLKFSKKDIDKIVNLIRYHLFYYNVEEVGESSVRRLIKNAGIENMNDLLKLRMADRIGSGCPKAEPYKLRHLKYMIEKVSKDPISVKMLKINGNDIVKQLNIKPGKKIGQYLDIMLEQVLKNPKNNTKKYLSSMLKELNLLNDKELDLLTKKARIEIKKVETKKDKMTKEKYWIT
ncbi:MAG: HD domain-containing protein [Candidatus Pacebacteria bacterium]|nr:HD domain-containing protein [Candidatus Paceibacterota bacterium]MDD5013199.1 HD domain-containing protein [Candidatus Paceibacterota bacterium]